MSGQFPSAPWADFSITSLSPSDTTMSHSLQVLAETFDAQAWALNGRLDPNISRDRWAPIFSFAAQQKGQYDTFTLIPPIVGKPRGTGNGTILVDGADQTGSSLLIKNGPAGETILKDGDFFKAANHNKVYMSVGDTVLDGSGDGTLSLFPALLQSPLDEEQIIITDIPFTVRFTEDTVTMIMKRGPRFSNEPFGFFEAFNG